MMFNVLGLVPMMPSKVCRAVYGTPPGIALGAFSFSSLSKKATSFPDRSKIGIDSVEYNPDVLYLRDLLPPNFLKRNSPSDLSPRMLRTSLFFMHLEFTLKAS